jgi:hypothetical protein
MKTLSKIYNYVFGKLAILVSLNFLISYFSIIMVCDINKDMKVNGYEMSQFPFMEMWSYMSIVSIGFMILLFIGYIFINYRNL